MGIIISFRLFIRFAAPRNGLCQQRAHQRSVTKRASADAPALAGRKAICGAPATDLN